MIEHGFLTKLIRLIRATLDGSKKRVRVADEILTSFVILDGLKQGDTLPNLLFNIALEGAIRRAGVQGSGTIVMRSHIVPLMLQLDNSKFEIFDFNIPKHFY